MTTKTRCLLLAVLLAPAAASAAFKCVDEKGKTHIGDTIPDGCANVAVYEVSRSGSVIRKIDPPLTPAQLEQRRKEAEAQKAADKAAAEQKRKDEALLNTFSNEKEFDVVRDRQIEPLKGRIATAQERLREIDKRQKQIGEEMEFYKAGKGKAAKGSDKVVQPPHLLVTENERLESEKKTTAAQIASSEREIESLRVKYDTDKKRWVALKSAGANAAAAAGAGAPPSRK